MLTMAYAHAADQASDRTCVEHIANHAIRLALVQSAFCTTSDNATCVLTTVLQQG